MFKPLNSRVLIEPDAKVTSSSSGILLPENKDKPRTGVVVIGNGDVTEGDRVLFSLFGTDEVEVDGKNYAIVSDSAIIGIFL